jgi:probable DNA metabolism protein
VFDNIIHAWMSELPVEKEIIAYGRLVFESSQRHDDFNEKRNAAKRVANDHGNADTRIVLNAAANVYKEIHRMMGLLRFSPVNGIYTAKCAPDHLVIPALTEYFSSRFADTEWMIIDEKRDICLYRFSGCAKAVFSRCKDIPGLENNIHNDEWEKLWKHYHKTINNESRKNSKLQRQLMPERYWKYLPEKE